MFKSGDVVQYRSNQENAASCNRHSMRKQYIVSHLFDGLVYFKTDEPSESGGCYAHRLELCSNLDTSSSTNKNPDHRIEIRWGVVDRASGKIARTYRTRELARTWKTSLQKVVKLKATYEIVE